MLKAYKYRIYPNKEQVQYLLQCMGSCRYIYNKALALIEEHYKNTKKHLGYVVIANDFLKQEKK